LNQKRAAGRFCSNFPVILRTKWEQIGLPDIPKYCYDSSRNRDTHAIFCKHRKAKQMSVQKRVQKYRSVGGAADLARVEVLVPPSARDELVAFASRLRSKHRKAPAYRNTKALLSMCSRALSLYRTRILDNVDLDRLPDLRSRAAVIARAMIDRGDARAFALGREMLAHIGAA